MLRRPFFNDRFISPWREMSRLQHEMNRLFYDSFSLAGGRVGPTYPAMNVWTNQDSLTITAELPGVKSEDIDISVSGNSVTLSGTRQPDELKDGETFHRRERASGNFSRTFQLPFRVAADEVEASFKNGVLHLVLPQIEEDKPKKIAITPA